MHEMFNRINYKIDEVENETRGSQPTSKSRTTFQAIFWEVLFLLVITVIGGWLRFHNLGRDSLWFDELISVHQAHLPVSQLLRFAANDVHPPLWPLLLKAMLLFGNSATVYRFLPAFFGTISIPLLYILGRTWFSRSVGAVAAILLMVSPFHVWHSQDARMYTLLMFTGMISWYVFSLLLTSRKKLPWVWYIIASLVVLYTHYFGAFLLLSQWGVVSFWRAKNEVSWLFVYRWLRAGGSLDCYFFHGLFLLRQT